MNERAERRYRVRRVYRWLTVLWVPIIPAGTLGEWIECAECKEAFDPATEHRPDPSDGRGFTAAQQMFRTAGRRGVIPALILGWLLVGADVQPAGALLLVLAAVFGFLGFLWMPGASADRPATRGGAVARRHPPPPAPDRPRATPTSPRPLESVSDSAQRVWKALGERGESTFAELSEATGFSEGAVANLTRELLDAGLVGRHRGGRYVAVQPAVPSPPAPAGLASAADVENGSASAVGSAQRLWEVLGDRGESTFSELSAATGYSEQVVADLTRELLDAKLVKRHRGGSYTAVQPAAPRTDPSECRGCGWRDPRRQRFCVRCGADTQEA